MVVDRAAVAFATLFCAATPVLMVVANKSSPLLLAACAAGLLFAACRGSLAIPYESRAGGRFPDPTVPVLLGGVGLAVASTLWSIDRSASLKAIFQCLGPVVTGVVVLKVGPGRLPGWAMAAIMVGAAIAAVLFLVEQRFGMPIRDLTGGRKMLFELNRPALVLLLFSIPLLSWITTFRIHHRFLAIVALGLVCTVFVVTDSMTTQLAAMAALGAFLLCRLFPRLAVVLVVAAMVAALWLAPRMGELAGSVVSPHLETRLATGSPAARIAIWSSFGEAARAAPLYGTGFGTTSTIRESDFSSMVSHERREMLGAGHPHNAYLQIAVEFGVIGQILATFGLVAMGWSIGRRGPGSAAPRLALLAAVGATSLVGHGAWQAWWIAAIVMTIMLIQHQDLLLRRTRETLA